MKYLYPIFFLSLLIIGCANKKSEINSGPDPQSEKQKFVWDLNSNKNYVYSFEQITNSVNIWKGSIDRVDTSKITGTGNLEVKSKGNDKADFVLALTIGSDAFNSVYSEKSPKTIVIPDMNADGNFESNHRDSDAILDLIFSLPSKDLEIGESEKLDVEIPFNIIGSPLYVKGFNELKYLKDVSPHIALIKSKFKIEELNVPSEIKGEFMCSFSGEAEYEFDYKEKYFKSSKLKLKTKMKSKVDTGENELGEIKMDMNGTSFYVIEFLEIKK